VLKFNLEIFGTFFIILDTYIVSAKEIILMVDQNISFFNKIYDSCFTKLTSFVAAKCGKVQDVEDILQEVFVEFYSLVTKKGIDYINDPEALIMQIAKFKLHKHYKSSEKRKNLAPYYLENQDGEEYEQDFSDIEVPDRLVNNQTVKEILDILQGKEQVVLKIFTLYYYLGNTIKEIAIYLEMSESHVKHKLYRTLAEIRKIYNKEV
jgi:RNA polymerase sigma-70 factor (ECF subfamily)